MPSRLSSDDLDRHLRHIAHSLVDEAPAPPPLVSIDPSTVSGLRQRRPQRRYLAAAVAAVSVALIGTAGLVVTTNRSGPTGVGQPPIATEQQRMILRTWPGELRSDGSIVPLGLGDLSPLALTGAPQPLPGGRHVTVGERNPSVDPAPRRSDYLVVVDADGTVEVERQVGTATEWVELLAATPREAILIKARRDEERSMYGSFPIGSGRIFAHDLATGAERALPGTVELGLLHAVRADVTDHRLVLVHSSLDPGTECPLLVIDLTGPAMSSLASLANCSEVRAVRVSPDGQLVAVTYANLHLNSELRVAVVDLGSGVLREDVRLGEYGTCATPPCDMERPVDPLGVAWTGDTSVRVALLDLKVYPDVAYYGSPIPRDAVLLDNVTVE